MALIAASRAEAGLVRIGLAVHLARAMGLQPDAIFNIIDQSD